MAKKHKNLDNIPIQWDGNLTHPQAGDQNQSIPASVDLGVWGGYVPVWFKSGCYTGTFPFGFTQGNCQKGVMDNPVYFEDYDLNNDGVLDNEDRALWWTPGGHPLNSANRSDLNNQVRNFMLGNDRMPDKAPKNNYTWGDVSVVIEIADGIGTGSRRAREARLHKFDKDTKKRLIHLICRVKGEKVYDEEKEVGDIQIKLEDADLVIKEVLGKMRVENTNVL